MSDDHVQLPIKLEHVRAAYQTAPVPSLATYVPKASGEFWPCNVSGRGDPPKSLKKGALLCDVSSTVSSWYVSSVCPR